MLFFISMTYLTFNSSKPTLEQTLANTAYIPQITTNFTADELFQNTTISTREKWVTDALKTLKISTSFSNCILQINETETSYDLRMDCAVPEALLPENHRNDMASLAIDTLFEAKLVNLTKPVNYRITYPLN